MRKMEGTNVILGPAAVSTSTGLLLLLLLFFSSLCKAAQKIEVSVFVYPSECAGIGLKCQIRLKDNFQSLWSSQNI